MRKQIVINDKSVDLLQEVSLNITKQLIDIQNPEQRKTDRTLTIDIPGSSINDELFGHLFEVNVDLEETSQQLHFNPAKKAPVVIYIDTIEQLRGYCQLTDIVVTNRDKITYKIVCYGEVGDLFAKMGNSLLEDLDLSEFDHTYNGTNIGNSWATSIIQNGGSVSFEAGKGYVYPMVDYGFSENKTNWKVEYFRPAVYAKQYIDKIFEAAGYTYTSDFFNSDFFKKLIIPFNGEKFIYDEDEIATRLFYAGISTERNVSFLTSQQEYSIATPIVFDIDSTDPYFDPSNIYSSVTGKFVCEKAGKYKFSANLVCKLKKESGSSRNFIYPDFTIQIGVFKKRGSKTTVIGGGYGVVSFDVTPTILGYQIENGDESSLVAINIVSGEDFAIAGDEYFIAAGFFTDHFSKNPVNPSGWKLIIPVNTSNYFLNTVINDSIYEGSLLALSSCIPQEVKQRDFLGSLIRAFNLYTEPHPDIDNNLIIEPRADYYTGQFTDWTLKQDVSKEFTIQPLAGLDAVEYYYSYTQDEDYINKDYKTNFNRIYGDYTHKVENDFVKNTKKIELVFAPTPSYSEKDIDRIIPYIAFTDQNGIVSPKASKIRLLQYGGLMPSFTGWNFTDSSGSYPQSYYPFAGHHNHPYYPSFDLNFGLPAHIYYETYTENPIEVTNQNLFTKYWYVQQKELGHVNSKLVEGWFYLTPEDIYKISFRKYYFIKDAYYRLLKVENYDPVFSKVTKCQFLKVLEFDAPLAATKKVLGGTGTFTTETTYKMPTIGTTSVRGGNSSGGGTIIVGEGNQVGGTATYTIANGTNNIVFTGSERINLLGGGDNTVFAGLTDVMLINCSGLTVTEPNVVYINNQKFYTGQIGGTISIDEGPYTLTDNTRTLFADASAGSITVYLPTAVGRSGKVFEIIKTDTSENSVTITADGSELINSTNSHIITAVYGQLAVTSNGAQWYKIN